MSNDIKALKIGDRAFITCENPSGICGESLHEVEIISKDGDFLCTLICIYNNVAIGDTFRGALHGLYKSKNEAIDAMIKDLKTFKDPKVKN